MAAFIDMVQGLFGRRGGARGLFAILLSIIALPALAQPVAQVALTEATIAPNGLTRWTLTLDNSVGVSPAEDLSFAGYTLPTGVTVSAIPRGQSDCIGGTVTASPGASTISLANGRLGAGETCFIALDLQGAAVTATLPSFNISSNLGTFTANAADLTVNTLVMQTALSLAAESGVNPNVASVGQLVNVIASFTVPATENLVGFSTLSVLLPEGLEVAAVPNESTDCPAVSPEFVPGTSEVTWRGSVFWNAGTTCTVEFRAIVTGLGDTQQSQTGLTGRVTIDPGVNFFSNVANVSAFATDRLNTTRDDLYLTHSFTPAIVRLGSAVTVDYVLTNTARDIATGVGFSHDLGAINCANSNGVCATNAPGWIPTNLPLGDVCGLNSMLVESSTGVIELSNASIDPGGSCTVSIATQLPGTESEGLYTSTITDFSGAGLSGGVSQASLRVQSGLEISFEFDSAPAKIGAGTPNNLVVTLTNASTLETASDISGLVELPSSVGVVALPAADSCGAGSSFTTNVVGFDGLGLAFSGASVAANDSCSFIYAVESVEGFSGVAEFESADVVVTANAQVLEAPDFSYAIEVTAPPQITLAASPALVSKGESFDLVVGFQDGGGGRENIALTLDVEAELPGQTPGDNVLLASNSCVGGSFALANGVLTVSGLDEQDCQTSLTVTAATTASLGSKTFSATAISATDGGITGKGPDLSATVHVGALVPTVTVTPGIALPTDNLTLTYTLQNVSGTDPITSVLFTDRYSSFISGSSGTLVSSSACGTPTITTGPAAFFTFSGISIDPGTTCTVTVLVSNASNVEGTFRNSPSAVFYTQDGAVLSAQMPGDTVTINSSLLGLSLTLSPEVVMPGGNLALSAALSNGSAESITGGAFDVDIGAVIPGATFSAVPANGFCGVGSSATESSAGVLSVTGIEKIAGATCTVDGVQIAIPGDASPGNYVVTSGTLTADNGITGPTGSAQFGVGSIQSQRSVDSTNNVIFPGEGFELDYSLSNLGVTTLGGIAFSDDLGGSLAGVSAGNTPLSDVCGVGSQLTLSGGILALQGASLGVGGNCNFSVTVQLPAGAALGAAQLSVVDVTTNGLKAGEMLATAVDVQAKPALTLDVTGGLSAGQVGRITATLDNAGSTLTASNAALVATLPAGLVLDVTTPASTTCTGGTLTAVDGASSFSYENGAIPAGTGCTVAFDVTASQADTYNVLVGLTSSSGTSDPANIDVFFAPLPAFSLSVDKALLVEAGDSFVATYTIDNSAGPNVLSTTSFTHSLQGGLQVAGTATFNAGSCPDTVITASVGSALVSVDVGATGVGPNLSCVIDVPVVTTVGGGDVRLTTSDLTSSAGVIAPASVLVNINGAPVLDPIGDKGAAEGSTLSFTVSATDADVPADTLTFAMTSGPAGSTFDPGSQLFTWTPQETDNGMASATFRVTDNGTGALFDEETITITVAEVNLPPTLDPIANQTVNEGELLSLTLTASDADLPSQTLSFALESGPDGMAVDAATGVLTWTPTEAQGPGDYPVTVSVTDDGAPPQQSTQTFTVTVNEVNTAPVLTPIGDRSTAEETEISFTVAATDADLPAQTLTYSMTGAPEGATLNANTGVFSWTPTEAQSPGSYTVTFVVTDDGDPALSAQETITITVTDTNKAPVLAPIGDQTIDEGELLSLTLTATDDDEPVQSLTYTLVSGPEGMVVAADTGVLTWTPTEAQGPGDYPVTVSVTDDGTPPLSTTESFTVTVQEVNQAPTLDPVADIAGVEGQLIQVQLSVTDPDIPPNTIEFGIVTGPQGLDVDASGMISWQTGFGDAGSYVVTVSATDGATPPASDQQTFVIELAARSADVQLPNGASGGVSFVPGDSQSSCQFAAPPVFIDASEANPAPPSYYRFVNGLVSFTATSCAMGETISVTIDYGSQITDPVLVFKTGEPYVAMPTQQSGSTVTYTVTDGGQGDADGVANGEVVDPAGAVFVSSTVPRPVPTVPWPALIIIGLAIANIARAQGVRRMVMKPQR